MADNRQLLEDIAGRPFARAALIQLDRAWPDTATLDIFSLGAGTDEHRFSLDVQFIVDQGLMQYDLVMIAGLRTVYRYAAITQHGREVVQDSRALVA